MFASRWFNAVAIYANITQVEAIRSLPFFSRVVQVLPELMEIASMADYDTLLNTGEQLILNIFHFQEPGFYMFGSWKSISELKYPVFRIVTPYFPG